MKPFLAALLLYFVFLVHNKVEAQSQKRDWGKLSGGLESNIGYYVKDDKLSQLEKEDKHGLNSYLNLGYRIKRFSFGIQYDIYAPPLKGYCDELEGNKPTLYYATYNSNKLGIILGSFHEQFGSGLAFRTYEERGLGINNALRGAHIRFSPTRSIRMKIIFGQPLKYLDYAESLFWGVDGHFTLSNLWEKQERYSWNVGGSWIHRKNQDEKPNQMDRKHLDIWSIRSDFNLDVFTLGIEYTQKGMSGSFTSERGFFMEKGSALLANLDLNFSGFGFSGVFRRLEYMDFRIDNNRDVSTVSMNYIPALTKQHKYTLAALYPYSATIQGEIGGQGDLFCELQPAWLGKHPLRISLNGSYYRTLGYPKEGPVSFWGENGNVLFREFGIELERKLTSSIKAIGAFYYQDISSMVLDGHSDQMLTSQIAVIDLLWKMNRKSSLRTEIQHMNSDTMDKSWLYGLIELGIVPNWMFFVSDLYNYGTEKENIHYYNGGISFSYKGFRSSLSYGRNRGGLVCIGGICRMIPSYTGLNITLSLVF